MDRLSVTVRDRHVERLDEWQADENAGSRSEALREVLDEFEAVETESAQVHTEYEELRSEYDELRTEYEGLQSEYDDLHTKHEALQTKRDQLRDQLTAMNSRQEDVAELVEYVETERSLAERREELRRQPIWRRAKWWLLGTNAGQRPPEA